MDRLGFWGLVAADPFWYALTFQYPLMDRLGFWGFLAVAKTAGFDGFSIR